MILECIAFLLCVVVNVVLRNVAKVVASADADKESGLGFSRGWRLIFRCGAGAFILVVDKIVDSIQLALVTSADGSTPYAPEAGRYHLWLADNCTWSQRTRIAIGLLELDDAISFSTAHWHRNDGGWWFREGVDALQPEFEKVLEFILLFDLTVQIDAFEAQIDRLLEDLRNELGRVNTKYEGMWNAVPDNLAGGAASASLSVATSLF